MGARSIAAVDLFCGAGGLTHGLLAAGVPVAAGTDLDAACQLPFEANHGRSAFYQRDVAKLKAPEVEAWFGGASTRILAGCPPCQPFSNYSQRYDTIGTPRWRLLSHFGRLVEALGPDIVVLENVPLIAKHAVFEGFLGALKRQDYAVWHAVIDCSDYGLPQRRKRLILLASRHGPMSLPAPTKAAPRTVAGALSGMPAIRHGERHKLDALHASARLSEINLKRIKASKPGGTWRDWPPHLRADCHRRSTGKNYSGVYGRMRADQPAPTLTTQFYSYGSGRFGHPYQDRALSLREGAVLQGFPLDYVFAAAAAPVHFKTLGRLIGNAVPVDIGRLIGEAILVHVNGARARRFGAMIAV